MTIDAQPAYRLPATLTQTQADGLACVVCGADYLTVKVAHTPVGRSHTGSQVFACSASCVASLASVEHEDAAVPAQAARGLLGGLVGDHEHAAVARCLDELASLEKRFGTRVLDQAVDCLRADDEFGARVWGARPEKLERYRNLWEAAGGDRDELPSVGTAEPFPGTGPIDDTAALASSVSYVLDGGDQ